LGDKGGTRRRVTEGRGETKLKSTHGKKRGENWGGTLLRGIWRRNKKISNKTS